MQEHMEELSSGAQRILNRCLIIRASADEGKKRHALFANDDLLNPRYAYYPSTMRMLHSLSIDPESGKVESFNGERGKLFEAIPTRSIWQLRVLGGLSRLAAESADNTITAVDTDFYREDIEVVDEEGKANHAVKKGIAFVLPTRIKNFVLSHLSTSHNSFDDATPLVFDDPTSKRFYLIADQKLGRKMLKFMNSPVQNFAMSFLTSPQGITINDQTSPEPVVFGEEAITDAQTLQPRSLGRIA